MKYSIRKYEVTEVDYKRYCNGGGKIHSIEQLEDNVLADLGEFGGKNADEQIIAEYATCDEAKEAFEAYTISPAEDKKPIINRVNIRLHECDVSFFALIESTENEEEFEESYSRLTVNVIDDTHADMLYDCNITAYVREDEEEEEEEDEDEEDDEEDEDEEDDEENEELKTKDQIYTSLHFKDEHNGHSFISRCLFKDKWQKNADEYNAFVEKLIKSSVDTEDFVKKYLDMETAVEHDYYKSQCYQVMLEAYENEKTYVYCVSMFGNKARRTVSDAGALRIGNDSFKVLFRNGYGDGDMLYAVLDNSDFYADRLMEYVGIFEGDDMYVYASDCGDSEKDLKLEAGRYAVHAYHGLVAIVKI